MLIPSVVLISIVHVQHGFLDVCRFYTEEARRFEHTESTSADNQWAAVNLETSLYSQLPSTVKCNLLLRFSKAYSFEELWKDMSG